MGTNLDYEDSNADEEGPKTKKLKTHRNPGKRVSFQEVIQIAEDTKPTFVKNSEVSECRACKEGYFAKQGNRFVEAMAHLIKTFAYNMHTSSLVDCIYRLAEKERQETIENGDADPGEWTREQIEYHLWTCMTNFELFSIKQLQNLKTHLTMSENSLYYMDEEGNVQQDEFKKFQIYFGLQNQIKHFSNTAPEKSNSFNPKLSVHSSSRKDRRD